jgi:hypothetical protein
MTQKLSQIEVTNMAALTPLDMRSQMTLMWNIAFNRCNQFGFENIPNDQSVIIFQLNFFKNFLLPVGIPRSLLPRPNPFTTFP